MLVQMGGKYAFHEANIIIDFLILSQKILVSFRVLSRIFQFPLVESILDNLVIQILNFAGLFCEVHVDLVFQSGMIL